MDVADAPGYAAFVLASAGSRRMQKFIVGNGQRVPNEGQAKLNLEHMGVPLESTFQVAEVTRPLMSVGRVCDQGLICLFDKDKAMIQDNNGKTVCQFERKGGLYVAKFDLKDPRIGFDRDNPKAAPFGRREP